MFVNHNSSIQRRGCQGRHRNSGRIMLSLCSALALSLGLYFSLHGSTVAAGLAAPIEQEQADRLAIVGIDGGSLYAAVDGAIIRALAPGDLLKVLGRTVDTQWLEVTTPDAKRGWVQSDFVIFYGIAQLPVTQSITGSHVVSETMINSTQLFSHAVDGLEIATPLATAAVAPLVTMSETTTAPSREEQTVRIVTNGARLNIRSGPGTGFAILGKAQPGDRFVALGRTAEATWIQIELKGGMNNAGIKEGWVSTPYIQSSITTTDLPVIATTVENVTQPVMESSSTLTTNPPSGVQSVTQTSVQPRELKGKLVIQSVWGGLFYLYDLATGDLRALTSGLDPALSPDGQQIAFTRIGGDATGVYLIDSDGNNERKIFGERDGLMSPKWSPDGAWLVFSYNDGFYQCRLVGISSCLSDQQIVDQFNLPPNADVQENILNDFDRESHPSWMLARVNTNGDEYRDLVALNSARAPDWTAAGILYQSAGGLQVTHDTPEAETARIFADGYGYDWDPDWQPRADGTPGRIIFQSREGSHWEIFTVNPDGSGHTALTRPDTTLVPALPSNVAPVWSPDGPAIAFLSNRGPDQSAAAWHVWVMDADGSNQRQLPLDLEIQYGFSGEQMIDWGP